jgi:hypothetical protein
LICVISLIVHVCFAQNKAANDISEVSKNSISTKWVITPVYMPNIILSGNVLRYTYNTESDVVRSDQRRLGLTFEKYRPNGNRGYGTDVIYENNSYLLDEGGDKKVLYQDDRCALRPFITFNNNTLSKDKFRYIDIGIDTRFLIRNRRYDYADSRDLKSSPYLKRATTYLMLRVGRKTVVTNHYLISRVGLSRFELDLTLPIFELGNQISSPGVRVLSDSLFKGSYTPSFISVRYAESIDTKPRNIIGFEQTKLPKSRITKFFFPPVYLNSPLTSVFGGFYTSTSLFIPTDTFNVLNVSDTLLIGKGSGQNISLGFNLGFGGNYTPYYSTNRDFRHFLLSVGVRRENLFLRNDGLQFSKRLSLESGLSFQYGFSNRYFLSAGYLYIYRFRTNQNSNEYELLFENKHYIRAGFGFMHGIGLTLDFPVDFRGNKYQKFTPLISARFGF